MISKSRLAEQHITADKRLRYASPKLPSATSFIRKTLYAIMLGGKNHENRSLSI